jgi:hypothetical protein
VEAERSVGTIPPRHSDHPGCLLPISLKTHLIFDSVVHPPPNEVEAAEP